jgi:hypothetical protein
MDQLATGTRIASWRVPCNSWGCPDCAPRKAKKVSNRVAAVFEKERVRFLTVTLRPQGSVPEALERTSTAWNRLRGKIVRKYGKVKYFKVVEFQRSTGMPHLHILINKYVSAVWLNGAVQSSGFGQIFKIKDASNAQIYSYVVKYLRKGFHSARAHETFLETGARRFGFSRGCTLVVAPRGLKAFYLLKASSLDPGSEFVLDMWYRFLIRGRAYPVASSQYFVEYFMPSSSALLLPRASAAPLRPAG